MYKFVCVLNCIEIIHVCQTVSTSLGSGKVKVISKEEALMQKDIEQADFDALLVNLRMDAVYIKESMNIKWAAETGIIENIGNVAKEYKETRNLMVTPSNCKQALF